MSKKAFSLTELLVMTAIIAILAAILFPVFRQAAEAAKVSNKPNLKKIALAAQRYGQDYDDRIPIMINGRYRDLLNIPDGVLSAYDEPRTDGWSLLLLPYVQDRTTYIDPRRDDIHGIWSGPALATSDAGYVATGNTYRNQSRFPYFGVNYEFLSPLRIPDQDMLSDDPTGHAIGESHGFFEADHPGKTLFYLPSDRGYVGGSQVGILDATRGFWGVNAPGLWGLVASTSPYIIFWNGTNCSGDWCGDADPGQDVVPGTDFAYIEPTTGDNNVVFLDGHISTMIPAEMAAGTNYLTSTPNDAGTGYFGGGAVITNKSKYLWNLNDNFYGLY